MTKINEINLLAVWLLLWALLPLWFWIMSVQKPDWGLMWGIAFLLYGFSKVLTLGEIPSQTGRRARCAYGLGWPGMNPVAFLDPIPEVDRKLLKLAIRNMLIGAGLLWGLGPQVALDRPFWGTWVGMTGLVFLLHFGAFHALAYHWQRKGFAAPAIMNRPLCSRRVAEFWGLRWNRAFQWLIWKRVFQPLRKRIPAAGALWVGFLVSGLIHELVITLPARGGYGGPTLYFLLQSLGIGVERRWFRKIPAWAGHLWTLSVVLLPVGLLFPEAFVLRIMLPMFQDWGIFR